MTSKTITGILSWLRGWFFTKDEIVQKEGALQTQINNKASQSDFNTLSSNVANKLDASDYVVDNSLSDSSTNPVQNKVINTALSNKSDVGHIHDDRYYTESEVDDLLDDKLDSSAYVVDSALSPSSTNPVQNKKVHDAVVALSNSLTGKAPISHSHTSAKVTESTALSNIGTSANATQHDVNSAIDSIIGNLTSAELINVVTTLPTASASTQNALYLLSDDGQYDIYITTESSGSYSWEKLDDDVLSDLSIDWSDIQNKPSTFTPSSHSHGYINNDGTISSATVVFSPYNRPLIKDHSDGKVKAGATPTQYVLDSSAYSNIGSSPASTQYVINGLIDTAIGNINTSLSDKASKSEVIDWDSLTFVAKADDETGAITFDYLE